MPSNRSRIPPLNALKVFESAARHLSFKAAAEELHVSQSAVSHQVKLLEEYLNLHLFVRKTRSVELTPKGKLYYPPLREAFDLILEGSKLIKEDQSDTIFTLHVYSTFTIRWLLPRLNRFQKLHPNILIRLHTTQADVNFAETDLDASIMIGQPNNDDLHYEPLFRCELFPVCSPDFLEKSVKIRSPSDLRNSDLLHVFSSPMDWHVWLQANKMDHLKPEAGLQFESYDVALSSAAQRMGVALGQQPYMEKDLASGVLIELFPGKRVANPNRWFFVCRKERFALPKIQLLVDWLKTEIESDTTLVQDTEIASVL